MAGRPVQVLAAHIVNFDFVQLAKVGGVGERGAGRFGVDVDAHGGAAADDHGGVGNLAKAGPQRIGVERGAVDDELGAVAELAALVGFQKIGVNGHGIGLVGVDGAADALQAQVDGRPNAPLQRLQRPAEHGDDAQAAGVHDAGLFQHGQLFGGAGQCIYRRSVGGLPEGCGIGRAGGGITIAGIIRGGGGLGGGADYRQHGAFLGLADGLVSGGGGGVKSVDQAAGVQGVGAGGAVGESAQHLGEDDAAVAAGAPESAGGQRLGHGAGGVSVTIFFHAGDAGAEGEQHIGAGVAVGDGEHIEGVGGVAVEFQVGGGALPGAAQLGARHGGGAGGWGRRHRRRRHHRHHQNHGGGAVR